MAALLEQVAGRLVVALARGKAPGRVQCPSTELGRRRPAAKKRLVEPAAPLGEIAAHPPELPQRGGHPQPEARLARVERPGERLAEVVALCVHAREPGGLLGNRVRLGELEEMRRVAASDVVVLQLLLRGLLLERVLADRRQHLEPGPSRSSRLSSSSVAPRAMRYTATADSRVKPPPRRTAAKRLFRLVRAGRSSGDRVAERTVPLGEVPGPRLGRRGARRAARASHPAAGASCAAASSTASGSRRAPGISTAAAFSSVSRKRGSASARSTNSATASSRSSGSSGTPARRRPTAPNSS
jgi:hypothetical protein